MLEKVALSGSQDSVRRNFSGSRPKIELKICSFSEKYLSVTSVVYDRNHYFGLGPVPKPKPKLADTYNRYRNRYQNYS